MKKRSTTLTALTTLVAGATLATQATTQGVSDLDLLVSQCETLDDIQDDRSALQRELDALLSGSSDSLLCSADASDEERQLCIDQCVGALASLLDISPIAELPEDPY